MDITKERQIILRKIIDDNQLILDKNLLRLQNLRNRENTEVFNLDNSFLKKIYKNIPIIKSNTNIGNTTKILYDGRKINLCEINISTCWSNDKTEIKILYSNNWDTITEFEVIKLNYLKTIVDRINLLKENLYKKREFTIKRYDLLMDMIDTRTYSTIIFDNKHELEIIHDELKFDDGLKYIFVVHAKFQHGTRKSTKKILSLKILKTTKKFCTFEVVEKTWESNTTHKYRKKKTFVLELLKKNKYNFDKNTIRSIKLKRLLEGMA